MLLEPHLHVGQRRRREVLGQDHSKRPGHRLPDPGGGRPTSGESPDYHRQDLFDAIRDGDFPSWTLKMQIMPFEEARTYRFNPFADEGLAAWRLPADHGRDHDAQPQPAPTSTRWSRRRSSPTTSSQGTAARARLLLRGRAPGAARAATSRSRSTSPRGGAAATVATVFLRREVLLTPTMLKPTYADSHLLDHQQGRDEGPARMSIGAHAAATRRRLRSGPHRVREVRLDDDQRERLRRRRGRAPVGRRLRRRARTAGLQLGRTSIRRSASASSRPSERRSAHSDRGDGRGSGRARSRESGG